MFDPSRRCTPVSEWPTPDRVAWCSALDCEDVFDPAGVVARRWGPGTRKKIANGYGRWLGWLERSGQLDLALSPGARATEAHARAYLQMLQEQSYAPYTIANRLQELGDALSVLAPDGDWTRFLRAANRIHQQARPVKDVMKCLRPPGEIVQFGLDLMHAAETDRFRTAHDRAVLFRDGLALATLVHRPLRITNFAGLTLEESLIRQGDTWRIYLVEGETKNGRPFECWWPDELVEQLERYVDHHRRVLLERATSAGLWIAKGGAQMSASVLRYRFIKRTTEEFGIPINPHAFRHNAATTLATEDPENVTAVASILGHSSLETSERYYNRAKMIDAGARFQATINAARRGTRRGRPALPQA